jgi:RecB family exonuclease
MNLSGAAATVAAVPTLSYSSSRTYLECPLRWKFLYVDRLTEAPRGYFSFGRTIHSVLETLVRPLVVPSARRSGEAESQRTLDDWHPTPSSTGSSTEIGEEDLLAIYEREWVREGYTSPEEEARYRTLGAEMLRGFYAQIRRDPPRPVAVEQHLEASWDGIPVHGYIDRIDRAPGGGLAVVDYKTSRELRREDARDSDQLSLYQVLVEKNYSDPVEELTLYHLRSLTPLKVPRRPKETLESLYDRLGTVSDGIRAQAFDPTPGRQCARCEFQSRCPEFRSVPPTDRERLRVLVDRFARLRAEEARVAGELERTAEELHRSAEELGVHRMPGSTSIAIRHKEESWQYPPERIGPILQRAGIRDRLTSDRPEEVRRIVRDPSIDPETRRRLADAGTRRVKWYWEFEEGGPAE